MRASAEVFNVSMLTLVSKLLAAVAAPWDPLTCQIFQLACAQLRLDRTIPAGLPGSRAPRLPASLSLERLPLSPPPPTSPPDCASEMAPPGPSDSSHWLAHSCSGRLCLLRLPFPVCCLAHLTPSLTSDGAPAIIGHCVIHTNQ